MQIDIDVEQSPEHIHKALVDSSIKFKNNHLVWTNGDISLTITCIPDIVDKVEWFHDGLHISSSYAKILIERSLNECKD